MEVYNVLSFQKATDPYIFDLYVLGSYGTLEEAKKSIFDSYEMVNEGYKNYPNYENLKIDLDNIKFEYSDYLVVGGSYFLSCVYTKRNDHYYIIVRRTLK